MPESQIVVLARSVTAAALAGYRNGSRRCTVVTPRNVNLALRGFSLDRSARVIALALDEDTADGMLEHSSVAPAWIPYGKPNVEHVSTH